MPVLLTLNEQSLAVNNVKFYNYEKANWQLFRQIINDNIVISNKIESKEDFDTAVDTLINCIQVALNKAVPCIEPNTRVDNLTKDILDLIVKRNKIRRIY